MTSFEFAYRKAEIGKLQSRPGMETLHAYIKRRRMIESLICDLIACGMTRDNAMKTI